VAVMLGAIGMAIVFVRFATYCLQLGPGVKTRDRTRFSGKNQLVRLLLMLSATAAPTATSIGQPGSGTEFDMTGISVALN